MLLLSIGLTWTTFWSNEARFTSGTRITEPDSGCGSSCSISLSTAMIEAYSVPCEPATTASTGPGLAPWTTVTGMLVAAPAPAGTSRKPWTFWPRSARAVPTPMGCAAAGTTASNRSAELHASLMAAMIVPGRSGREEQRVVAELVAEIAGALRVRVGLAQQPFARERARQLEVAGARIVKAREQAVDGSQLGVRPDAQVARARSDTVTRRRLERAHDAGARRHNPAPVRARGLDGPLRRLTHLVALGQRQGRVEIGVSGGREARGVRDGGDSDARLDEPLQ